MCTTAESLTSLAELELDSLFLREAFPAAKERTSSLSLKACEVFSYSLLVADVHPLVAAVRLTQKSSFLLPNQTHDSKRNKGLILLLRCQVLVPCLMLSYQCSEYLVSNVVVRCSTFRW